MKQILVVVDMQKDFTTGPLGNAACAAVVPTIADIIKSGAYDRIIFTKDTHQETYLQTQEGQRLPVAHCIEGTPGWEIVPELSDAAAALEQPVEIICKPAFGSVRLGERLREICKTDTGEAVTIDFCGVCTGICVISNVLIAKAFVPEVPIRVIGHACACVTPESHRTAIAAMKTCQVDILEEK